MTCLGVPATIVGTDQADHLIGTSGRDVIAGLGGNDVIDGGGGNDLICGAGDAPASAPFSARAATSDDDTLIGGPGNDVLVGGGGSDTASYANDTAPVTASLDGLANDGPTGETDLISTDIENITGGTGNDTLIGNAADNQLNGGVGSDTLNAGAGSDVLIGGPGDDHLDAGPVNANDSDNCEGVESSDFITTGCLTTPPVVTGTQASHVFFTMPALAAFGSSEALLGHWALVIRPYDAITNAPLDGVGWSAGFTCTACTSPADGISSSISFLQPSHGYYLRATLLTDQNSQVATSVHVPFATPDPVPLPTPPEPTVTNVGVGTVAFSEAAIPEFASTEAKLSGWNLAVRVFDAGTGLQVAGYGWPADLACSACASAANGVSAGSNNLTPNHSYVLRAEVTDQFGQSTASGDVSFTTLP